ncbi:MAG: HU family DNA-binding protein [Tildeniella torsiva UHER 1998/13D]|jgi:DNA-binding protein HU-beta|nr:HU family DNA-binding protein [Tildeniella torsiva UHER 1998/13D]
MNKAQLTERVAANAELTQKEAGRAIDAILEAIMGEVANSGKVTLVGFGTFEAQHTKAREGRNPSTGEPVHIPAKVRPKFKPGKEFKAQVGG